jgi:hypothetical protein
MRIIENYAPINCGDLKSDFCVNVHICAKRAESWLSLFDARTRPVLEVPMLAIWRKRSVRKSRMT